MKNTKILIQRGPLRNKDSRPGFLLFTTRAFYSKTLAAWGYFRLHILKAIFIKILVWPLGFSQAY